MDNVNRNMVANFIARGWLVLISFAMVPLYIRFLGVEAYGLIGFYVTLQTLFSVLDFGLSATLNRELARFSTRTGGSGDARDLLRTVEIFYWLLAGAVGASIYALAPRIARDWIRPDSLPVETVSQAVMMMGAVLALQWPSNLYAGGMRGLQRQVLLNFIVAGMATLRAVGAVLVLWLIAPTVLAFFTWQLITSTLATCLTRECLWKSLPTSGRRARLRGELIKSVWQFAAGMSIMTCLIVLLGQLDKVILSKILSLRMFGYYVLASTIAAAVATPVSPVSEAVFPRFCQLVALGKEAELTDLFHQTSQVISVIIFSICSVVAWFTYDVLVIWTGDTSLASNTHVLSSILVIGTAINYGTMHVLDLIQMSYNWLKAGLLSRLIALLGAVPLMILVASRYGAMGAALSWLLIYAGYLLITPHFVFRRLMVGKKAAWYVKDLLVPLCVATICGGACRAIAPALSTRAGLGFIIGTTFVVTVLATSASTYYGRHVIIAAASRIKKLRIWIIAKSTVPDRFRI
jgi:O-antigen/teichoic acid export membrane protein